MKDNRLLLFVLALLAAIPLVAQKKEISQARTILKSKKNVQQAEQLMTKLLNDSANRSNKRIYQLWYESVQMQYEAANEKMYLKQKQDTADFFALTQRMFNVAFALDSLDVLPDKKGRVAPDGTSGDLIVTYQVMLPEKLTERQKQLLLQMKSSA